MNQAAPQQQIQEQINALRAATEKATESKEAAIRYLVSAGIIDEKEKRELEKTPEKKPKIIAPSPTISSNWVS